jgi:hypothetical protein
MGTISAACRGEDEPTPLEEFFQQVQADYDAFQKRTDRLEDELRGREDGDFLPELEETFTELVVLRQAFVDELDTLNPPSEAEDAFDEYLAAGRELVRLQTVILYPGDEVPFQAVWERYQDTCRSLEEIADANGIVADLECSEGL